MPRPTSPETEAVNPDSFLDIVASVVSIMIIMVLMTGLKIKHTPLLPPAAIAAHAPDAELTAALAGEQALHGEVLKTAAAMENIQRETALHMLERDALGVAIALEERRLAATRQQATARAAEDFAAAHGVDEARDRLEQLHAQREALATAAPPPQVIENFPTPLSHAVDGEEVHFQLRGKRLARVPWDALLKLAHQDAHEKFGRSHGNAEMTGMVGPEEGFRLRYTVELIDRSGHRVDSVDNAAGWRFKRVEFIPLGNDMGETVAEALAPDSQFLTAITPRRINRNTLTVTLWTYPDSFDAFRQVKKELYRLGFAVAAWPLESDQPIAAGANGSKSAAE